MTNHSENKGTFSIDISCVGDIGRICISRDHSLKRRLSGIFRCVFLLLFTGLFIDTALALSDTNAKMPVANTNDQSADRNKDQSSTKKTTTPPKDNTSEIKKSVHTSDKLIKLLAKKSIFTVAVMPMENVSLDGDIAYYYRQRIIKLLIEKGYTVIDSTWIDNGLVKLGLTHAGQLRLLKFEQLKKIVDADGFVFGIVEEARSQNALVYNSYIYKSSIKMDSNTGENLWYSLEQRVTKRRIALDPINALLDIVLIKNGGDAKAAVGALADRLLESLPKGPSQVVVGEDLFNMAIEMNN